MSEPKQFKDLFQAKPTHLEIMEETFEVLPDGVVESEWSEDRIKKFMQDYLMMDTRGELPMQNKKSWGYDLWIFCIDKYADGLSFSKIAAMASGHFDTVKMSSNPTKFIGSIINHRGWKLAARMRLLIRERQIEELQEGKASSAMRAQRAELEHLSTLEDELKINIQAMSDNDSASEEYAIALKNVKELEKLISKFSGSDMMKKLQEFKAREAIKSDGSLNHLPADPKNITPKIIG